MSEQKPRRARVFAAERLRSSLAGVRCVSQAVVIALGNARRSAAMSEQHRRIESLVEELRRRTAELEEANRELQRNSRYRSLFLQRMSHELRTPLTSILGFAEILLDQERLTDAQRRFCEIIQSAGFQQQASLNQLVDLSRLEAGRTEIFLHEFSLRETLRETCATVARLAQKQGATLDCTVATELGGVVSDGLEDGRVVSGVGGQYNFVAQAFALEGGRSILTLEATTPLALMKVKGPDGKVTDWRGLLDWLTDPVCAEGKIDPLDIEHITCTDDLDDVLALVEAAEHRRPRAA